MVGDFVRLAPPDAVSAVVLDAMLEGAADHAQPERLAEYVGMDGDVHHQRVVLALLDHFIKLFGDHVAESLGVALTVNHML